VGLGCDAPFCRPALEPSLSLAFIGDSAAGCSPHHPSSRTRDPIAPASGARAGSRFDWVRSVHFSGAPAIAGVTAFWLRTLNLKSGHDSALVCPVLFRTGKGFVRLRLLGSGRDTPKWGGRRVGKSDAVPLSLKWLCDCVGFPHARQELSNRETVSPPLAIFEGFEPSPFTKGLTIAARVLVPEEVVILNLAPGGVGARYTFQQACRPPPPSSPSRTEPQLKGDENKIRTYWEFCQG
jgi:hypothetical protein